MTGAGGMLGQDVARAVRAAGHLTAALTRADLDVCEADHVARLFEDIRPDAVINCAAYTDVDGAEADVQSAMLVNGDGAGHVAAAAAAIGATVVYPSTDYVFDGSKTEPYVESDATAPQSAYGRSKLAGERRTAQANERHHVVRTSWLFGLGGRNFVETMLRAGAEHGEVRVVDDQVGCPTYTPHLAPALVALAESPAFGLTHLAAAGQCSWFEFAREIFTRARVACRVERSSSDQLGRPAKRPAYSVLRSERRDATALPHWREGLTSYLAERAERGAAA